MFRVLRVGIILLFAAVILQPALAAAPLPPATRWIPQDAIVVLQVNQPKAVLDLALSAKMIDMVTATPVYKQQTAQAPFRDLLAGIPLLEQRLKTDWKSGLHKLLGGGVTLAVLPGDASLLLIDAEDEALLKDLHGVLVEIAKGEAAKQGHPDRVASKEVLGVTQWTFNGEEAHALIGKRLVFGNRAETLKAALELRNKPDGPSLAALPAYQAAQKALDGKSVATLYANMAVLKKTPSLQQTLKQDTEFIGSLLFASVLEGLRDSNWLALGLRIDGTTLHLEAATDGKTGGASSLAGFMTPKTGEGVLPNLQVPRQIAALSFYRDLHAFYAAKDKLFPERTSGLIFFENMMGIFFSGRDLTKEVFGETWPEVRVVVAEQEYDKAKGAPQTQMPAFAVVFHLRHPQEFAKVAEEAWQKAVGLINVTRGQKGQPGLIIDRDIHEGTKYSVAVFSEPKEEDKEARATRLNYRPALVCVGDYLVISSTDGLVRDLIVALKKEAKAPGKPLADTHSLVEVDGVRLASILQANHETLVNNNMVEKGNTAEQAKSDVDFLITLVKFLGRAKVTIRNMDGKPRADLEVNLNLP